MIPVLAANKFIVASSIVTFILTAIIVAAHFHPVGASIFVGTKVEGTVTIVLVAFWTFIVIENTNADKGLAPTADGTGGIHSANLYYFSWAGFITAIVILVNFLGDAVGVDIAGNVQNRATRLQWWAAIFAASVVVMGSAAHVHRTDCGSSNQGSFSPKYCRETKWAIAGGVLSSAFSAIVIATKILKYTVGEASTAFMLEICTSFLLMVMNAFVVAYVTSASGPGHAIGNLYYFSWAMFLIASVLASECYSEYANPAGSGNVNDGGGENGATNGRATDGRGDIEVETFDDNI